MPSLVLDIRYYSNHNFMGRRVQGYNAPMCVLTTAAARALALVAQDAGKMGSATSFHNRFSLMFCSCACRYALKAYDCYRPKQAVADFVQWAGCGDP